MGKGIASASLAGGGAVKLYYGFRQHEAAKARKKEQRDYSFTVLSYVATLGLWYVLLVLLGVL